MMMPMTPPSAYDADTSPASPGRHLILCLVLLEPRRLQLAVRMVADQVGLAVEVGVPEGDVPSPVTILVEDPDVGLAIAVLVEAEFDGLRLVVGNVEARIDPSTAVHVQVADGSGAILGAPLEHDLGLAGLRRSTGHLGLVGAALRCRKELLDLADGDR